MNVTALLHPWPRLLRSQATSDRREENGNRRWPLMATAGARPVQAFSWFLGVGETDMSTPCFRVIWPANAIQMTRREKGENGPTALRSTVMTQPTASIVVVP